MNVVQTPMRVDIQIFLDQQKDLQKTIEFLIRLAIRSDLGLSLEDRINLLGSSEDLRLLCDKYVISDPVLLKEVKQAMNMFELRSPPYGLLNNILIDARNQGFWS